MTVTIVDYDAGNLRSLANMIVRAGGEPRIARSAEDILNAERLILPGVGAAGSAVTRLRQIGMDEALDEAVRRRGVPMLGICLGMQLLAERLHEYGEHRGLGWVRGDVVHLKRISPAVRQVPHTGWSEIEPHSTWADVFGRPSGIPHYYFNHSFALMTDESEIIAATVNHGISLAAAVIKENVAATQFHPEISQKTGRRLITQFLAWSP